jgi:hypothetical protein
MTPIRSCLFLLLVATAGCARGPNVTTEQLPLRKVVVYRNGVGYFQRSGEVDSDKVTFKMRRSMVGDFLATLAIVERGGSSVRAASFPLDIEEFEEQPPMPLSEKGPPRPLPPPKPLDPLREVAIELDGKEHDLLVGYVAKTPVWRPSYRVVIQDNGQALLQTWGVVQNLSGEDWENVELSLVAGAPMAFESTLGEPVIPPRPVVTDQGEVILQVPEGSTSLAEEAPAPPPAPAMPAGAPAAEMEMADRDESAATGSGAGVRVRRQSAPKKASAGNTSGGPGDYGYSYDKAASAPAQSLGLDSLGKDLRRVSALANVAVQGSNTVYALPNKVTVPNSSATMVLLVNQSVPGESLFLFSPDPGVPDSVSHPFRVARFANTTSGLLEKGPIAVFGKGSFLGEGVLEPLPPQAKATVPFALDRGLAVQTEQRSDQRGARLYRIEAGHLYVERDSIQETTYTIKNGNAEAARILLKHPRSAETTLEAPPPGTEDNIGSGFALIPAAAAARGQGKLTVIERRPWTQEIDWLDPLADLAIKAYLESPKRDPKVAERISSVWAIRSKLRGLRDENDKLQSQQAELSNAMDEIRRNLRAIEKNTQAGDLRTKLTGRLAQASSQYDGIAKRLVELDLLMGEQQIRLRDAVLDLNVPVQTR